MSAQAFCQSKGVLVKNLPLFSLSFKLDRTYFDNQVDPYNPDWWANETLAILEENMVAASLVNRDFEPYFAKYGDIVNTRRPRDFTAKRKVKGDAVTTQDAIADNVAIRLDQWNHVSFIIDDIENTMSMKKLSDEYARPAGIALARFADRIVLGQYPRFFPYMAGKLQGLTTSNTKDAVLDVRKVMDDNKAPDVGRNLVLSSKTEADMLRPEFFTSAEKVGDAGTALRTASLGTKFGINFFKDINTGNPAPGNTRRTFQINLAAGYVAGTTALTIDTGTGEITPGTWIDINGFPYQVVSRTGTAPTTAIVLSYGLRAAVANDDPIYVYTPGAVNLTAGYAAGYGKEIVVDNFSVAPQIGQLVSFGSDVTNIYTIIDVTGTTGITLDRCLAAAIANDDTVNIGPPGSFNLLTTRNALTLAIRPLQPVAAGAGAISTTVNYNGLTIRVTISYDAQYQRHRWTFDHLLGIEMLDKHLGAVLLG